MPEGAFKASGTMIPTTIIKIRREGVLVEKVIEPTSTDPAPAEKSKPVGGFSMIENVRIDRIIPHPRNPRKCLGDLTELADSIRESGIFQNLTVVPTEIKEQVSGMHGSTVTERHKAYMVIIGHRRLEAAKMAGLTEVPCIITEMDEKTQLATMLLENMQRSDLTPLEEAEGMQLMISLGDTFSEVAKRTGLSETTIRRRTKWVRTFGADKLAELQDRNISFDDYEKLYKVEDDAKRNALLEKIGTSNFDWDLKTALGEQTAHKVIAELDEMLATFATKTSYDDFRAQPVDVIERYSLWSQIGGYLITTKALMENLDETKQYFYTELKHKDSCYLYTIKEQDDDEDAAEAEQAERERQLDALIDSAEEAFGRAYDLRLSFVRNLAPNAKHANAISRAATGVLLMTNTSSLKDVVFRHLYDIDKEFRYAWQKDKPGETFQDAIERLLPYETSYLRSMLVGTYCRMESPQYDCITRNGEYEQNVSLENLYNFLASVGYAISTEEQQLLDGTHQLYEQIKEYLDEDDEE